MSDDCDVEEIRGVAMMMAGDSEQQETLFLWLLEVRHDPKFWSDITKVYKMLNSRFLGELL